MANTLSSVLITKVLDNLSRSSTATTRSGITLATVAIDWLNWTEEYMSRKHDFKEMQRRFFMDTTISQKTYQFPTNLKTLLDMRLIDGSSSLKLTNTATRRFDKLLPYPENWTTSRPSWYNQFGKYFDLYAIPDAAYRIHLKCCVWSTKITASTETIDYEPDKDELIIAGMTYRGFRFIQMYEDAAYWKGEFRDMLAEAISIDDARPDYEPVAVGFDSGAGDVNLGDYWNRTDVFRNP